METVRRRLSGCRNELKGIAIVWICFFHAQLGLDGFWYQVQRIGYGGVDLFFFLSGFGLYHSLSRDADIGRYMRRRAQRILPAYLPFCLAWLAVMLPLNGAGLTDSVKIAVGNLSMLGFLTGSPLNINWYTGALLMSMLLAPFFHALLRPGRRYWLRALALLAGLFALGLSYIGDTRYMFISRLPVMAIGMMAGGCTVEARKLRWLTPVLAVCGAAALAALFLCMERYAELLVTYGMYWHPFALITPVLCVGLSALLSRAPAPVRKPLKGLGEASFEIFLFNAWVELLGKRFALFHTPAAWLAWSAASIAAGLAYHRLSGAAYARIRQKIASGS